VYVAQTFCVRTGWKACATPSVKRLGNNPDPDEPEPKTTRDTKDTKDTFVSFL